jgi:Family of unknown function (DUF5519)
VKRRVERIAVTLFRLKDQFGSIEGVLEAKSRFADRPAWWVGGTEIAHFDDDEVIDIRLTAKVIRSRRVELAERPEITFRPSSGSDWLEIRVDSPDAERLALELVKVAAETHRGRERRA